MEKFNEMLDEIYMNYDTMHDLESENTPHDEITDLFREEIEYPDVLTNTLLKLRKSYLKSVAIRIKSKLRKNKPKDIKNDLMNYNKLLEPLLDKILSSPKFQKEAMKHVEEVVKVEHREESAPQVEKKVVEEEKTADNLSDLIKTAKTTDTEKQDDNYHLAEFMNEYIEKGTSDDHLTINEAYEFYQDFHENNGDYDEASKKDLKKFLSSKCGKYTSKGYSGYKISEDDEESE